MTALGTFSMYVVKFSKTLFVVLPFFFLDVYFIWICKLFNISMYLNYCLVLEFQPLKRSLFLPLHSHFGGELQNVLYNFHLVIDANESFEFSVCCVHLIMWHRGDNRRKENNLRLSGGKLLPYILETPVTEDAYGSHINTLSISHPSHALTFDLQLVLSIASVCL